MGRQRQFLARSGGHEDPAEWRAQRGVVGGHDVCGRIPDDAASLLDGWGVTQLATGS
jgi:hypothetical protein